MTQFAFEGITRRGLETHGVLAASSRAAAVDALLRDGVTPLSVVQASGAPQRRAMLLPASHSDSLALALLRDLGALIQAGLTVERALSVVAESGARARAEAAGELLAQVRQGRPLSEAMAVRPALFPPVVRGPLAAGEASGRLGEVLVRLASDLARAKAASERIQSALLYPLVVCGAMIVVLAIVFTVVLPRLRALFEGAGAALPWTTRAVVAVSDFFAAYGDIAGALAILALAGVLAARRAPAFRPRLERLAFETPLLGAALRNAAAARFTRTLALLIEGGLPLSRALDHAIAATENTIFKSRLAAAAARVRDGTGLRRGLAETRLMPPVLLELAAVGEETGRLAPLLEQAAAILEDDSTRTLERVSALLAPAATLLLGGVIAFLMAGVVGGLLSVNDAAGL